MKRLITVVLAMCCLAALQAQNTDSTQVDHIIYKVIPKGLHINDKIFVVNNSPYTLLQIVVARPRANGRFEPLGTAIFVSPNETYELGSWDDNWLKYLRGQQLAIKVKGISKILGEEILGTATAGTNWWGNVAFARSHIKELDPNIINKISPEKITYDFDVTYSEADHDLYIRVYYKGDNGGGVMDF